MRCSASSSFIEFVGQCRVSFYTNARKFNCGRDFCPNPQLLLDVSRLSVSSACAISQRLPDKVPFHAILQQRSVRTEGYVPKHLARSFFSSFNFLLLRLKKEVTACALAKSKNRWALPNLHGETLMKRLCHFVTNFTTHFVLLCGFGLASPAGVGLKTERNKLQIAHTFSSIFSPFRSVELVVSPPAPTYAHQP